MATLGEFLSPQAGQERRKWLDETLGYYLPPELRGWVNAGAELNPVTNMERAGTAAQRMTAPGQSGWDRMAAAGDMATNMGAVLAPVAGASKAGVPAANAIAEALTAASPMRGAVQDFAADEFGGVKLLPGQSLDDALRAKYPDVKLSVTGNSERGYTLGQIVVPKDQRGAGVGSAVMRDLLETADEQGATVALTPTSDFGGSVSRLREFYRRFGFVPNKGRNADYSISEGMYRLPARAQ